MSKYLETCIFNGEKKKKKNKNPKSRGLRLAFLKST